MNWRQLYEQHLARYGFTDDHCHPLRLCVDFEKFIADIRRAERERCANRCRSMDYQSDKPMHDNHDCAVAIEALGDE